MVLWSHSQCTTRWLPSFSRWENLMKMFIKREKSSKPSTSFHPMISFNSKLLITDPNWRTPSGRMWYASLGSPKFSASISCFPSKKTRPMRGDTIRGWQGRGQGGVPVIHVTFYLYKQCISASGISYFLFFIMFIKVWNLKVSTLDWILRFVPVDNLSQSPSASPTTLVFIWKYFDYFGF